MSGATLKTQDKMRCKWSLVSAIDVRMYEVMNIVDDVKNVFKLKKYFRWF